MNAETKDSYRFDPLFQTLTNHLQNGEWDAALDTLEDLQKKHPYSRELSQIQQEILIKKHLEVDEEADNKRTRRRKISRLSLRIALVVLLLIGIYFAISSFSDWIVDQVDAISQSFEQDFLSFEQRIQYRDAQSYLQANYPEAALEILYELKETREDFPELEQLITEAEEMKQLKTEYEEAVDLLDSGDSLAALQAFEEIYEKQSNYLDVAIKIEEIKGQFYLLDALEKAESAFENEDWESSASQYESLRAIAPDYKPELIEVRLIRSYMNIAAEILAAEAESPSALDLADTYFRKALVLRPRDQDLLAEKYQLEEQFKERLFSHYLQAAKDAVSGQEDSLVALEMALDYLNNALILKPNDSEAITERDLATAYLQAQIDFQAGLTNQVINNLEYVYSINPLYANGTALQTLYESYMERGDIRTATGELEAALEDFKKAAEISLQADSTILKLYFAKVKIAELQGMLSEYSVAVNNYKEAVELINLLPLLEVEDKNRAFLLQEAERYADIEWYRTSYRLYRQVLPASDIIFETSEVVIIKEGDYLSRLANLYNTTVQEILDANELPNINSIQLGQEIKIPVLKNSD